MENRKTEGKYIFGHFEGEGKEEIKVNWVLLMECDGKGNCTIFVVILFVVFFIRFSFSWKLAKRIQNFSSQQNLLNEFSCIYAVKHLNRKLWISISFSLDLTLVCAENCLFANLCKIKLKTFLLCFLLPQQEERKNRINMKIAFA